MELLLGVQLATTHLNDVAFLPKEEIKEVSAKNLCRFRREFDLFLKILNMDEVKVLVVLQDARGGPVKERLKPFEMIRKEILQVATLNNAYVADLRKVTQSDKKYFTDVIHMNKEGNRVKTQYIASEIRKIFESENT